MVGRVGPDEGLVQDQIGLFEAGIQIPERPFVSVLPDGKSALTGCGHVVGRPLHFLDFWCGWSSALSSRGWRRRTHPDVAFHACVGPPRTQARDGINGEWKRLQLDLNAFDRLRGCQLVHRRDGQNRLALVHDLFIGQHRLVVWLDADQAQDGIPVVRHISGCHDGGDARKRFGLRGVDPADLTARDRAAHHLQPEHVRVEHVVDVLRLAGHMADSVAALDRLADDP